MFFIFCFFTFFKSWKTTDVFLVIFNTCDVVYNWSSSIVLDNLFGYVYVYNVYVCNRVLKNTLCKRKLMKNFSIFRDVSKTKPMPFQSLRTHILVFHQLKKIFILFNKFYFLENVLTDFEIFAQATREIIKFKTN